MLEGGDYSATRALGLTHSSLLTRRCRSRARVPRGLRSAIPTVVILRTAGSPSIPVGIREVTK